MSCSFGLPLHLPPCPFIDARRTVLKDMFQLPLDRDGVDRISQGTERQAVHDVIAHDGAGRRIFERVQVAPGAIGSDGLDVGERFRRPVSLDPALPGQGDAEPADGVIELGAFEHLCPAVPLLHHEPEPVRRDVEKVPGVLEKRKGLCSRQRQHLRRQ